MALGISDDGVGRPIRGILAGDPRIDGKPIGEISSLLPLDRVVVMLEKLVVG